MESQKTITDEVKIDDVLDRGTIVQILPTKNEFREKLLSGEKLRFYWGFDATGPNLHLSHAKNFILMEKFRKLGHEVIVLFGDFTARIGDPSGEDSARKQLSREEVLENVKRWKEVVKPLMDFQDNVNPPKIMYNHDWLSKLTFEDVINLASNFTVQQMLERDMFENRLKEKKPIYLHEFLYPLMQGYDSVAMEVDVEMCGTDQIFNALAGRTLLKKLKNKEKFVVAATLMANPKTGDLMSKTKGTGVFFNVSADDLYGQIMAQPDEMIEVLFINVTPLSLDEIKSIIGANNPKEAKMRLAEEITKIFHGEKLAAEAVDNFMNTFSKGGVPDDLPEVSVAQGTKLIEMLLVEKIVISKSEFRRLVSEGAVTNMDSDKKVEDPDALAESGVYKVGKRRFIKIKVI
ncbi:tyrosine--tRNA ligase [Patescibacteria group bacterium]|nr:tyrosine--tRNA ligase [Patescibacteria group bacterium]